MKKETKTILQSHTRTAAVNDLIACYRRLDRDEFEQLKEQRENGTLMFRACIQAALDLMPKDCTPDVYGDIVRSAAAVCCHNSGTDD